MSGVLGSSLYGNAAATYGKLPALLWQVLVKWDGADNTDEAPQLMDIQITRGRKNLLRGGDGLEPNAVGECVMTFRNTDGRYDPLNSSSAIYPNCAPGKQATITVSDGPTYNVIRGHIYNIQPIRGSSGAKRVRITVRDGWQWLKDRAIRYDATANVNSGTAISNLLTAAQYPYSTAIDTGNDTIPYWWASNKDAKSEIQNINDSEFGVVYCAGDGTLTFKKRSTQWTGASAGTWTGAKFSEIDFAQPWEITRNVCQIKVYPTEIIANGTGTNNYLWKNDKTFKLRPSKSLTFNVEYRYGGEKVSAINVITPVASTDYRAFANANGTGKNLTSSVTVTLTAKGEDAQLVITNNGTRTAYITALQVRGDVINKTNTVVIEHDTSGGTNRRTFLLDNKWQQDIERSALYASYLAQLFDDPRANPVLRTNTQKAGLALQMAELATVQTLDVSTLGINRAYRLAGAEHKWDAYHPNVIFSNLYFENVDATNYWIIGTSTFDSETVLAY